MARPLLVIQGLVPLVCQKPKPLQGRGGVAADSWLHGLGVLGVLCSASFPLPHCRMFIWGGGRPGEVVAPRFKVIAALSRGLRLGF